MEPFVLPQLEDLQKLHGRPVVIYNSTINNDAVCMLYECLRDMGPTQELDLVLSTSGGIVTVARQLALILREFTQHLTILVPYRARSAGTLLCLNANELVLGPMAELGPIDTHISSAGVPPSGTPGIISAEDIRMFRQMAEDWFGVSREKDRLQVLALMAQSVFPPSLSSFYRSEKLIYEAAHELLCYQLPDSEDSIRQRIVNQLIRGYNSHDHIITRAEAQNLGLRVHFPSHQEETLLWDLLKTCQQQFLKPTSLPNEEGIIGLIMSSTFCARQVQRWVNIPGAQSVEQEEEVTPSPQKRLDISWEVDGE